MSAPWPAWPTETEDNPDRVSYIDFLFEVLGDEPIAVPPASNAGRGAPPLPAVSNEKSVASRVGARQAEMLRRREEAAAKVAAVVAAAEAARATTEAILGPATRATSTSPKKKSVKTGTIPGKSRQEALQEQLRTRQRETKIADNRDQGKSRRDFRTRVSAEDYLAASDNLVPVVLASRAQLTPGTGQPTVDIAGAIKQKLKEVCIPIYGESMTNDLAENWTPRGKGVQVRYFFEIDTPTTQCAKVFRLYPKDHPVHTYCWECGYKITSQNQCEHVFPILFALIITGLYDTLLHQAMERKGLGAQYLDLLTYEYRSAHDRCNQLKTDDVYIKYNPTRRGADALGTFSVDTQAMEKTLGKIASTGYTNYSFKYENLAANWTGPIPAQQWKGITPKLDAGVLQAGWKATRVDAMSSVVQAALTKFKLGEFTMKQLSGHFVNGLLQRAIFLEPVLTKEKLWSKLTPEQQQSLTAWLRKLKLAGGSRRRTPRARAHSRRTRVRGGGEDDWADVVEALVSSIVKDFYLARLYTEVKTTIDTITASSRDVEGLLPAWREAIGPLYERHIQVTNDIIDTILTIGFEIPVPTGEVTPWDAKDAVDAILHQSIRVAINSGPQEYLWYTDTSYVPPELPSRSVFEDAVEPELSSSSVFRPEPELPSSSVFRPEPAAAAEASTPSRPSALDIPATATEKLKDGTPEGSVSGTPASRAPPSAFASPRGLVPAATSDPNVSVASPQGSMARSGPDVGLVPAATSDPVQEDVVNRSRSASAATDSSKGSSGLQGPAQVTRMPSATGIVREPKGGALGPKPDWL